MCMHIMKRMTILDLEPATCKTQIQRQPANRPSLGIDLFGDTLHRTGNELNQRTELRQLNAS